MRNTDGTERTVYAQRDASLNSRETVGRFTLQYDGTTLSSTYEQGAFTKSGSTVDVALSNIQDIYIVVQSHRSSDYPKPDLVRVSGLSVTISD